MDVVKRRKGTYDCLFGRVTRMAWIWTVPLALTYLVNAWPWNGCIIWKSHLAGGSGSLRGYLVPCTLLLSFSLFSGCHRVSHSPLPCPSTVMVHLTTGLPHGVEAQWSPISQSISPNQSFFPLNCFSFSQLHHLIAMKDLTCLINRIRDTAASENTPGRGNFK